MGLRSPSLLAPWTNVVVFTAAAFEVLGGIFIIIYLIPLPYRDNIYLQEFEVYEQTNPAYAAELRAKAFGPELLDEQEMIRKGYLKEPNSGEQED